MGFLAPALPFIKAGAGLIGGLFAGKKANKQADTDSLRMDEGANDLRNVFNYALPTGKALTSTGQGDVSSGLSTARSGTDVMSSPLNYYKNIMSGNRTANLQAFAPETNALQQQEAARRQQLAATGTARGGGVASVNEEAKTRQMTEINNAIFGARPAAAAAITDVGRGVTSAGLQTAQVGTNELSAALNALGLGANSGQAIADIGLKRAMGSPGPLSPTGQARSAGQSVAQSGMDLANIIVGKLWPK